MIEDDLAAILSATPDAIMLPKAEGAPSVEALLTQMGVRSLPILPIATETPASIFQLGSYASVHDHLIGLTWGAEDLPAAIGAATAREPDGRYTPPYEMVRSLTLFAAHAARTAAIDTVFPAIDTPDALSAYVARARRDGFTGMMAIHPAQVAIINDGFTPTVDEVAHSRAIIDAFAAAPEAGALRLNGRMIDRPHLVQAKRILAMVEQVK